MTQISLRLNYRLYKIHLSCRTGITLNIFHSRLKIFDKSRWKRSNLSNDNCSKCIRKLGKENSSTSGFVWNTKKKNIILSPHEWIILTLPCSFTCMRWDVFVFLDSTSHICIAVGVGYHLGERFESIGIKIIVLVQRKPENLKQSPRTDRNGIEPTNIGSLFLFLSSMLTSGPSGQVYCLFSNGRRWFPGQRFEEKGSRLFLSYTESMNILHSHTDQIALLSIRQTSPMSSFWVQQGWTPFLMSENAYFK